MKRVISCSLCEECQSSLTENENASERDVLLRLKEFKRGALYRPSDEVFTLIQSVEQLFQATSVDSLMGSTNAEAMLEQTAMKLDSNLPSCHELKKKVLTRYIWLRLRIVSKCIWAAKKKDTQRGCFGSKSQRKRRKKNPATSTATMATSSRPLPSPLLVAMDVFRLSTPSPSPADSSSCNQPLAAATSQQQRCPPLANVSCGCQGQQQEEVHLENNRKMSTSCQFVLRE